MTIPSSLLTHVKTFDVSALKAAQGPIPQKLSEFVSKLDQNIAPKGPSASESLANFEPRSERLSTKLLYTKAKAGNVNPMTFESKDKAIDYAKSTLEGLRSMVKSINTHGGGDVKPGGEYTPYIPEDQQLNDTLKLLEAMIKDRVETSRQYLEIDSAILSRTFGIDQPVFGVKDGKVEIRAFDIEYQGEKIVRSLGGGLSAEYNAGGTLKVDQYL